MVQVQEITKAEMWSLYIENMLYNIVNLGDRIVAHTRKGMADDPNGYKVVYCSNP